jgi:hypothetical protein
MLEGADGTKDDFGPKEPIELNSVPQKQHENS